LAEWLVVSGREKLIGGNPETGAKGWLGWYNPETGRIYGHVLTCGATSRRFRHFDPNLANVPSPQNGAAYGEECRACWGVTPGLDRALVGFDIKGMETAILLDRIARGAPRAFQEAVQLLLYGDVHQGNADALTASLGFPVARGGGGA